MEGQHESPGDPRPPPPGPRRRPPRSLITYQFGDGPINTLTVIAPVYNEEAVIGRFYERLRNVLDSITDRYRSDILFVVDKSTDNTREVLTRIAQGDDTVRCLFLSSRFGHQMSLLAGLDRAEADAVIMMDSDLQHPPEVILGMLDQFEQGYDIVYTIRKSERTSGLVGRVGSWFFYRLIERLSDVPISRDAADFRLISRKVNRVFKNEIRERNQFLRGLFAWTGFNSAGVVFQSQERAGGKTKYSFSRRLGLASHAIVSFSKRPLRLAFYTGMFTAILSMITALFTLVNYLVGNSAPAGWTTLAVMVPFLSGIQLMVLGILGEYIGAIFDEVKARPHYIIEDETDFGLQSKGIEE